MIRIFVLVFMFTIDGISGRGGGRSESFILGRYNPEEVHNKTSLMTT
jgi:hypothetical protein